MDKLRASQECNLKKEIELLQKLHPTPLVTLTG